MPEIALGPEIPFEAAFSFLAEGMFYLLLLIYTVHVVILAYHWFHYGTSKVISMAALAAYLSGGAFIFLSLSYLLITFT